MNFTVDKDKLVELYINQKLSTRKCGEKLIISHASVQKYLLKYGIPVRDKNEAQQGKEVSKEAREKMRIAKLGRNLSKKHIDNLKGKTPWNKGLGNSEFECTVCKEKVIAKIYRNSKFCSKECRDKYSHISRGELHWNYKGLEPRGIQTKRNWSLYKEFKKQVHTRDGNKCVLCSSRGKNDVHHIDGWRDCEEKRFDLNNGITVCKECHTSIHNLCGWRHYSTETFIKNYVCTATNTWQRVALTIW